MQVRWANKLDIVYMNISGTDLFDQNAGMKCANVRLRCSSISLVLIYFIKMCLWHVLKLESHVHGYHWY